MTSGERKLLEQLRLDHARALLVDVAGVEDRFRPALGMTVEDGQAVSVSGTWQDETERLFVEARNVETMLVAILGTSPDQVDSADLPAKTAASLAQLRGHAENYQRLTMGR